MAYSLVKGSNGHWTSLELLDDGSWRGGKTSCLTHLAGKEVEIWKLAGLKC